jgi:hypothetical protein
MKNENIVETILNECSDIENVLNNILMPKFCKLHNIKDEQSMFKLKQEVIAENSFFMDVKKRYALYIINREGKECDEYDIKGMITRRSEFPELTKECVVKALEILIKEDVVDFEKLNNHLTHSRNIIYDKCLEGSKLIAKSSHFNKELEDYKSITQDVNGMLLWNKMEYEYFVPGTKGFLFKIHGIDTALAPDRILNKSHMLTRKNNCIVIPYEEEKLPDYYILNLDSQMKYSWDDRENEIMRVLIGNDNNENSKIFEQYTAEE